MGWGAADAAKQAADARKAAYGRSRSSYGADLSAAMKAGVSRQSFEAGMAEVRFMEAKARWASGVRPFGKNIGPNSAPFPGYNDPHFGWIPGGGPGGGGGGAVGGGGGGGGAGGPGGLPPLPPPPPAAPTPGPAPGGGGGGGGWSGIDQFRNGLLLERPTMERWISKTQRRLYEALVQQQGPDGPPILPNAPSYARQKGHATAGFKTGKMSINMADPACVHPLSADWDEVDLYAVPEGSTAEYDSWNKNGGEPPDAMKMTFFVAGQGARTITKTATRKNKKKANTIKTWKKVIGAQPPRPFVGQDQAVVDDVGIDMLDDIERQLGF